VAIRYFVQKIDAGEDPSDEFQPEGNVVDSAEITEEHYETIEKDRDAVERGFDGRWHEAFMTLVRRSKRLKTTTGRTQRKQGIRTSSRNCSTGS